jgi:carboxymethylenebutenolidase
MRERRETIESAGAEITIECFEPNGDGPFPAVVAVHGSNGMANGSPIVRSVTMPFVGMGYAVYLPHYFERTGTVRSDFETSRRNFLPWLQVVGDAVSHAAIQPSVDPARIAIVGISLGAFLGLSAATMDARISAVVGFSGGLPEPLASSFTRMAPALILHGENDTIVPVDEARKLQRALEVRGLPHDVNIYPNEGHIFSPLAGLDAARRTVEFLGRHLGDAR